MAAKNAKRKRGRPRKNLQPEIIDALPVQQPSGTILFLPAGEPENPEPENPNPLPSQAAGSSSTSADFERVAQEIEAQPDPDGAGSPAGDQGAPLGASTVEQPTGWTAEKIREIFEAVFFAAEMFRGDRWKPDPEKLDAVGRKLLPIFIRHVPYEPTNSGTLTEVLEWMMAGGAVYGLFAEPIRAEIAEYRKRKFQMAVQQPEKPDGTVRDTETRDSRGSSAFSGNPEPANHFGWAGPSPAVPAL